jgi:hypothetical protein
MASNSARLKSLLCQCLDPITPLQGSPTDSLQTFVSSNRISPMEPPFLSSPLRLQALQSSTMSGHFGPSYSTERSHLPHADCFESYSTSTPVKNGLVPLSSVFARRSLRTMQRPFQQSSRAGKNCRLKESSDPPLLVQRYDLTREFHSCALRLSVSLLDPVWKTEEGTTNQGKHWADFLHLSSPLARSRLQLPNLHANRSIMNYGRRSSPVTRQHGFKALYKGAAEVNVGLC